MKAADTALYAAKTAGRSTFKFFDVGMTEQLRVKREIEMELREAIDGGDQLALYYQPLLSLSTGKLTGFEALMRWRHPSKGMVSHGDFIPVAEETGLIVELGAWAMRTACREAMLWPQDIKVAVNVSSVQFKSGDLVSVVEASLSTTGLPARRLELEITESILMQDNTTTHATLHRLRELGVGISMDDFGTGYSSLSYLRSFPLNKIKIDRSFVSDLGTASDREVIIRSIIDIAHTLGMATTAEGVETSAQMEALRLLGCDEAQGYFISKPAPAANLSAVIAQWHSDRALAA